MRTIPHLPVVRGAAAERAAAEPRRLLYQPQRSGQAGAPTQFLDWHSREMEPRGRTAVAGSDRRTNLSLPTVSSEVAWRERHDGLYVDIEP
jgi:hypothetical protein